MFLLTVVSSGVYPFFQSFFIVHRFSKLYPGLSEPRGNLFLCVSLAPLCRLATGLSASNLSYSPSASAQKAAQAQPAQSLLGTPLLSRGLCWTQSNRKSSLHLLVATDSQQNIRCRIFIWQIGVKCYDICTQSCMNKVLKCLYFSAQFKLQMTECTFYK